MHRPAFAAAMIMTVILCCTPSIPAQAQIVYPAGYVPCYLPSWYPRGWELMIRNPCASYYYGGPYYRPTYAPYRAASHRVHRRPYLRPGWWW
jgi:hypothetical protein